LFKKFSFKNKTSYALAKIAEDETKLEKLTYSGSLANLYNDDFSFFIRYNIRDVEIITAIDDNYKFIELANGMAHNNTVLMDDVFGSVKIIETGVTNFLHNEMHKIAMNKNPQPGEKAEGAIVMDPKVGLHEWIGSVDINSLYPSAIRSINISPEKIVGQFMEYEQAWHEIYKKTSAVLHFAVENSSEVIEATAAEFDQFLRDNQFSVSGFGTVFDQGNGQGVLPAVLTYWYSQRKMYKKEKEKYAKQLESFTLSNGVELPVELLDD
jgi:DNA polymerase elongation subunit (family B)